MAGLFGAPSQSLFSGGWNAPTDGGLGALSKEDRLMALFAGLSQAGARMAQPGLSRGQQIAAGFGGIGQGMAEANQAALIQKLTGLKLGELKRKTEQEQKQQTAVDRLAMGFRTGGASGADMLRAGGAAGRDGAERGTGRHRRGEPGNRPEIRGRADDAEGAQSEGSDGRDCRQALQHL